MKRLTSGAAIFLMVCTLTPSPLGVLLAQPSQTKVPAEYSAKLRLYEQFVESQMKKDRIPGLTIGFTKDKYTWVKGFGYADLKTRFRPMPSLLIVWHRLPNQ